MELEQLRQQAENYRIIYRSNQCSREEAKYFIQPYLDLANKKSKELAKKYNQKVKTIGFSEFVR